MLNYGELIGRFGGWFALLGFLLVAWLANSSTTLIQHAADPLWNSLGWQPSAGLPRAAAETVMPALLFSTAYALLRVFLRKPQYPSSEPSPLVIHPHKGLIVSLSTFGVPGAKQEEAEALRLQIEAAAVMTHGSGANPRDRLLEMLYRSNWGTFTAAVELHASTLTNVWLLMTKEAEKDWPLAEACIRFLAPHTANVEPLAIADANNAHEVRLRLIAFYASELKNYGLREDQVIADITGGTKAMTAGIVLATLDEHRNVQYLTQTPKTLIQDGQPRRDLNQVFRSVHTSPADVARAFISYMESKTGNPPSS